MLLLLTATAIASTPTRVAGQEPGGRSGVSPRAAEALSRPGVKRHIANPPRASQRPEVRQRRSHYRSQVDGAIRRLENNRRGLGYRGRARLRELRRERTRLDRARR